MRDVLALLEGQKLAVQGTVSEFSRTRGYAGRPEALPQALADELTHLMRAYPEHDGDVLRILTNARQALASLSWARFKQRQDQLTRVHTAHRMMARHQGHRKGASHA
jgi:hypothetical protein